MRNQVIVVGIALVAATGCKGKDKDKQAAPAPGSAAPTAPATPPAPAKPAEPAVSLAPGKPQTGCFAWSPSKKAAACIVGVVDDHNPDETWFRLHFLGAGDPPVDLGHDVSADGSQKVNAALAAGGYQPIGGTPTPFKDKAEVAKVPLVLASKETDKGGDNLPPKMQWTVTATCGGKPVVLDTVEDVGLSEMNATARAMGEDFIVVELAGHVGREGEYFNTATAVVLDVKACKAIVPPAPPAPK